MGVPIDCYGIMCYLINAAHESHTVFRICNNTKQQQQKHISQDNIRSAAALITRHMVNEALSNNK